MAKIELTKPILGNYRLPIILFHSVSATKDIAGVDPYWAHHFDVFVANMKKEGFATITAKEAYDFHINSKPAGEKAVLLTFDDGFADSLIWAAPILQKYGYIGSIFVGTASIGIGNTISAGQLRTLRDTYGWDIQSHGHVSHCGIQISADDTPPYDGTFYNNLKWLPSEGRVETMEERHERIKSDLQQSMNILSEYNDFYLFAFPDGTYGATDEIKADTDAVLDELGMTGIIVSPPWTEQTVNIMGSGTKKHRMCRIGMAGERMASPPSSSPSPYRGDFYTDAFKTGYFEINVRVAGANYYGKHAIYDSERDRYIIGDAYGKIMIVDKNFRVISGPSTVQRPVGSSAPEPASSIYPTIFPNGDIWVASFTGLMLYKLDPNNIFSNALDEISASVGTLFLVNDGSYLYTGNDNGTIKRINPITKVVADYCTLPNPMWGKYEQAILKDGVMYIGDYKSQAILAYDLINKQIKTSIGDNGYIHWPANSKLFPWHFLDNNNLICWDEINWGHTVVSF